MSHRRRNELLTRDQLWWLSILLNFSRPIGGKYKIKKSDVGRTKAVYHMSFVDFCFLTFCSKRRLDFLK